MTWTAAISVARLTCRKLLRDVLGLTACKTFAYFFGAPAITMLRDTNRALRLRKCGVSITRPTRPSDA